MLPKICKIFLQISIKLFFNDNWSVPILWSILSPFSRDRNFLLSLPIQTCILWHWISMFFFWVSKAINVLISSTYIYKYLKSPHLLFLYGPVFTSRTLFFDALVLKSHALPLARLFYFHSLWCVLKDSHITIICSNIFLQKF